jgi:tRNA pseudouridine32 synthase / 23S rRNA pseudouridine746 synthase
MSELPIELVFEDSALLVLNKPSGLLSVPGRGPGNQDCLIARLQCRYAEALTVHRLDMATSGLLVVARSAEAQKSLSMAFESRAVEKRYVAVVRGKVGISPKEEWRLIDQPLAPDWPNRPRQRVDDINGRPSQTRYRVLGYDEATDTTRLELAPVTGRTHQLRVHLQAAGHAILGDQLYAPPEVQAQSKRLLLHASRLGLAHPMTGHAMAWRSEPPF